MKYITFLALSLIMGCASVSPIKKAITSDDVKLNRVFTNLPSHEVQILFSEVIRDKNGQVRFKEDQFQVDDATYFYPASTVKLPIALLALEKLNQNPLADRNTPFHVENDNIVSTFAKDIIDIFAVSSNAAYNRLFEYLGQDAINQLLKDKGINAQIYHRLSVPNSAELSTKPLFFYRDNQVIYKTESKTNRQIAPLPLHNLSKGVGYTIGDSLVNQPMDFSTKNYLPITSLHGILKRLLFPEHFPKHQQFALNEADRKFIIDAMAILPKEAGYDAVEYPETYVKYLVVGDSNKSMPPHLKIHNKIGSAYGYLTDSAYIINKKTDQEFLITATIHVNKNKIYNDGIYEYDVVGIPFLAALGRKLILEHSK